MAQIAAVAVDKATPQFDRVYSYLVPDGLPVQVGCRVTVPFGRGNRRRLGLVLSLSESEDTARLKKIASLVDRQPLIGEEQLGLMRWLREHTFCSWFDAVRVLIPAGLGMDWRSVPGGAGCGASRRCPQGSGKASGGHPGRTGQDPGAAGGGDRREGPAPAAAVSDGVRSGAQ